MTKDKAYIYVRISLDNSRQDTLHQINSCKEYCLKNNLEIVDIISDEGISAYRHSYTKRNGINRILELSHNKELPNLVIWESSRLSRQMLETQLLIAQLTENGTTIFSVTEGIINNKDNELSELLNSIRAFNNQSSSKQTSNRIISSKKLLAQQGKWQGNAKIIKVHKEYQIKYRANTLVADMLVIIKDSKGKVVPIIVECECGTKYYNDKWSNYISGKYYLQKFPIEPIVVVFYKGDRLPKSDINIITYKLKI